MTLTAWRITSGIILISMLVAVVSARTKSAFQPTQYSSTLIRPSRPLSVRRPQLVEGYGQLPLTFEANHGQTDPSVNFLSRGPGYLLLLKSDQAVVRLAKTSNNTARNRTKDDIRHWRNKTKNYVSSTIAIQFVGANAGVHALGLGQSPTRVNYFIGKDPKKWHANVPAFARVKYAGIYAGIDLVYYGNHQQLEYDFVVAPGSDPRQIEFDIKGAKRISINETGALVAQLDDGEMRWNKPIVYQETRGEKQPIPARYAIDRRHRVRFEVGQYDVAKPLIIDPEILYATYLGGTDYDEGESIAVDNAGNVYVTGVTSSINFPTVVPVQNQNEAPNGLLTGFVAKLNSSGSALVYSTYLGGTAGGTGGLGISVDAAGNAFVTGAAPGPDFPTTAGAFQPTAAPATNPAFVTKLDSAGGLVYSTYLGGSNSTLGFGIAVDSSGNAYISGVTLSPNFPTTPGAVQTFLRGNSDAFVTKLNSTGSAPIYSTYLGGTGSDVGGGIAVDTNGNAYVSGGTDSVDFPTTPGAFQRNFPGSNTKGFIAKLNAQGTAVIYATYLGGSNYSNISGIAVDSIGNAYVTGSANTPDFPTTPGALRTTPFQQSETTAFVAKLNVNGSGLVYSTYLDDTTNGSGPFIALDGSGHAFISAVSPLNCASVSELNEAGSALLGHVCLGGSGGSTLGKGIAVDQSGNAYVTGLGNADFFVTPGAFQTVSAGSDDAFVAKIALAITTPAHLIDTATAAMTCNSYTLTLAGQLTGQTAFVGFIIRDKSRGIRITGRAPVSAGPDGNFSGTATATIRPLTADYILTGSATLFSDDGEDNTIPISFPDNNGLLRCDFTPPSTTATVSPQPNANGWNNTDVTVALRAIDEPGGSGVKQITYTVTGATTIPPKTSPPSPKGFLLVPLTAEGISTITFFAEDNAGNVEQPKTQMVQIDKTPPIASANPLPVPNQNGWNNTNVTVSFSATDNLSGVDLCSAPLTFTNEGAGQTGTGSCTDKAGNVSAPATAVVNIDKTPPVISGMPAAGCSLWPPNHKLVQVAVLTAADALSGLAPGSFQVTGASNEPDVDANNPQIVIRPNNSGGFVIQLQADRLGTGSGRLYSLVATASDLSGNTVTMMATCTVPHDQGQ